MDTPTSRDGQEVNASREITAPDPSFVRDRFSQWAGEIDAWYKTEINSAVLKARRAANDELNQILRRLRQCSSTDDIASWLVDATSTYASRAALFEITPKTLRGVRARGFSAEPDGFHSLEVPLERAPAFEHSARERETVVAIGSAGEVSAEVLSGLGQASGEKVYLYPVVIDGTTMAVLYTTAAGADGKPFLDGAALELLTQAAASAAKNLTAAAPAPVVSTDGALVKIKGVEMKTAGDAILKKAKEARARWFARTTVAGFRLRRRHDVEAGRRQRNIYRALKPEIDSARRTYAQDFLAVSAEIADYLHKELLSLAHDDASLLGPEYPGSLV